MKLIKLQKLSVAFVVVVSSCASPKQFTDFNNYSFHVDKKRSAVAKLDGATPVGDPVQLTASTQSTPILFPEALKPLGSSNPDASLSRSQKKELKKEFKAEMKRVVSEVKKLEPKSTQAAQGWDRDLKLAAIFGAIGFALGALFGVSEILAFAGAVCIVIAIVFLIKWIIRQ